MEQSPWNQFNITPATSAYLSDVHTINNSNNGTTPTQLLASQNAPMMTMSQSGINTSPLQMSNVSLSSSAPLNNMSLLSQQLIGTASHNQHPNMMMGMNSQYQIFAQNQPLPSSHFPNQMVPTQMMPNQHSLQNQINQQQNRATMSLQPPPNLNVRNIPHQNVPNTQGSGHSALREQLYSGVQIRQPNNQLPSQQMQPPPPANSTSGSRKVVNIQVQQNLRPLAPSQPAPNNSSAVSKSEESKSQLLQFLADLKECSNKSKYYVSGTIENTYIVQLLMFKNMCSEFLKRSNNSVLKDQIRQKLSTMTDGEQIINATIDRSKFVQDVLDCIIVETNIWTPDPEPEIPKSCSPSPQSNIRVSQPNPPPNLVRVKKEPGTSTESCQTSCTTSQAIKPTRTSTPTNNLPKISFPSSIDELIRMSEEAAEPFNSASDGPNNAETDKPQQRCEVKPQLLNRNQIRPSQEPVLRQQAPVLRQQATVLRQQAPVPRKQVPVLRQQVPLNRQQAPVLIQQAPVLRQQAPALNQQAPVLRQQAPVVNQQAPVLRQRAPVVNQQAPDFRLQAPVRQQAPVYGLANVRQQASISQPIVNQSSTVLNFIRNPTNVLLNQQGVPGIISPFVPIRFGTVVTSTNYAQPNIIEIIPNQNQSSPTVSSTTAVTAQTQLKEIPPSKRAKRKDLVRPVSPNDMCRVELEDQKHISSCLIESKITDKKTKDIQKVKKEEVVCALSSDLKRERVVDPKESSYYWCNFCVYQTDHKGKLVNHVITAHRFSCQFCRFQCYSRADVVEHTVNVHKEASSMSKDFRYCVLLPDYLKIQEKIENHENDAFENECIQSMKTKKIRGITENDQNYIESDWEEEILGDDDFLSESRSDVSEQSSKQASDSEEEQVSKSPKQGKKRKVKRAFLNSSSDDDDEDQSRKRVKTTALEELKKKRKEKERRKKSKTDRSKKELKENKDDHSDQESPLKHRRRSRRNTKSDEDSPLEFRRRSGRSNKVDFSKVYDPLNDIFGSDNESEISDDTDNDKDFTPGSNNTPPGQKNKTLKSFLSHFNDSKSNTSNNNADNLMPIAMPVVVLKPLDTKTSDHQKASEEETVVSEKSVNDCPVNDNPTQDDNLDTNNDHDKNDEPTKKNDPSVDDSVSEDLPTASTPSDSGSLTINSSDSENTTSKTKSGKPDCVSSSPPTTSTTTSTNSNSGSGFSKNKVTLVKHCIHCDFVCDNIQEIKSHTLENHPDAFLGVWQSALNFVLYVCPNENCDFYASMSQDFSRHIGRCSYTRNKDIDKAIKDTTYYIQCLKDKRLMKSSDLETQRHSLKQFFNKSEEWTVVKPVGMISKSNVVAASSSPCNSPTPASSSKSSDINKPTKSSSSNTDDIMDSSTFYKCAFCSFKCMGNTLTVRAHTIKHHPEYPLYTINLRAVEEGHESRFVLFCVGQDCKEIFTQSKEYFKHVESCKKLLKLKNDAQLLKTNKFVKSTMYKL